jgi:uncharacterized metal-binding protein
MAIVTKNMLNTHSDMQKLPTRDARRFLFACSCGNNVGQLATIAASQLISTGFAQFGSIPALVTGVIPPEATTPTAADILVVVDGCNEACGRMIVDKAGFSCSHYLIVTQLGIDITPGTAYNPVDLELVKDGIYAVCADYSSKAPPGGCMCGL